MAKETIDTNKEITPVGEYVFTMTKVIKKLTEIGSKPFYIFKSDYLLDGVIKEHSEIRMAWQSGDLIRALGGKETDKPGIFEWDREEVVGKKVKAQIVHEPDRKDPNTIRARMINVVEEIPF